MIVNASNPLNAMPRKGVARVFLKKDTTWESGFTITPVDQGVDSPAREQFSSVVHRKPPEAVEAYWRKLIFSGMGVPPLTLGSDAEIVEFVRTNVGSIGYVSDDTSLGGGVKVLEVSE